LLERHAEPRRGDADVVEHDVEPAELLDGGCDRRLDGFLSGDVTLDGEGGAAGGLDLAHGLLGPVELKVGADDTRALFCEAKGRRPANTRSRAGDDRDLVCE